MIIETVVTDVTIVTNVTVVTNGTVVTDVTGETGGSVVDSSDYWTVVIDVTKV